MQPRAIKESASKKLKPVATSVATGFCSPQNEFKLTPHSAGARIILNYFLAARTAAPAEEFPAVHADFGLGWFGRGVFAIRRDLESLECESFDFLADEAFDGAEFFGFVGRDECEGIPRHVRTAGAADAVDIILRVLRDVVVDDMAHSSDVDTARSDVCGDHDFVFSGFESAERFDALVLRAVGMQDGDGMVVGAEFFGDLVGTVLGAAEDDRALVIDCGEQREEEVKLAAWIHHVNAMLHDGSHRAGYSDLDTHGIPEGKVGELCDFRREGGREKEGLSVLGNLRNDAAHGRQETDIEHAVDLVEDEDFDVVEADGALLEVVFQTAGGGDKNIETLLEGCALVSVTNAAINTANLEVGETAEVAHGGFHLHGEFTGRLKDEAAKAAVRAELLERGQREGGGFSCAGLGRGDEVAALQGRRNGAKLDGCRIAVTHRLDALQNMLGQSKR